MIWTGARSCCASAFLLFVTASGAVACGDDPGREPSTFGMQDDADPGDGDGDGDGDPGDGDGDPGDGDGAPGDGDGDASGDGDGAPGDGDGDGDGGCPGTSSLSGTVLFYSDSSEQGPFELAECEPLNTGLSPTGAVVTFPIKVVNGDGTLTVGIPLDAIEGTHALGDGYAVLLTVNDGLGPGWLGQYYLDSGTITLLDYAAAVGKTIDVELSATLVMSQDPTRSSDIDITFVATI